MLPTPNPSRSSTQEYAAEAPSRLSPLPHRMQLVMVGNDPSKAQMPPVPTPKLRSTTIVQFVKVGEEATRSAWPLPNAAELFSMKQLENVGEALKQPMPTPPLGA